jgi:hypothetical protein
MSRRTLLAGLAAAALAAPAFACAGQIWLFRVEREGRDIGRHRIELRPSADGFEVRVEIDLAVRFAFLTLYRYTHENREVWQDGRLLGFESHTDDNGTRYRVTCTREAGGFVVESSEGTFRAPPDAVATTYWHRQFTRSGVWIDSMRGHPRRVACAPQPAALSALDCPAALSAFAVTGELALDLTYAGDGLAGLSFMFGGARFLYRPLELPAVVPELRL